MVLLFIGPSGSGKDTQAEFLVDDFNFERISSGDLIRGISDGENPIQKIIQESLNEGFSPDNLVYGLLELYLAHITNENIILSGVVRRESQVELLDKTLAIANKKLDKVVYFELNDEEAVRRMSGRLHCPKDGTNYHLIFNPPKKVDTCDVCGTKLERRSDDNPDAIKVRLAEFHKSNDTILKMYEDRGILVKIDAAPSIQEVRNEVTNALDLN